MDIYVYGAGSQGEKIAETVSRYENINIVCFFDRQKRGSIHGIEIKRLTNSEMSKDIPVVISIGKLRVAKAVCDMLRNNGLEKLYWYSAKDSCYQKQDFWEEQCIDCSLWTKERVLPQVEMHVADFCNLNCRGCTHFSPIFPREFPNIKERLQDVRDLKEKFDHIIRFYILGGEPFLNPELDRYVAEISEILPETELVIVTNGLLLCNKDENILRALHAIHRTGAIVSISEYAPTANKIDDIRTLLERNCILYEIRKAVTKQKFNIPLSLKADSDKEKCCISDGCVTIWNGKIARCPTLMYIEKFNEVFGTKLPSDGIYNIKQSPGGEEMNEILNRKIPLCAHCVINEAEWAVCGRNPSLEDFATYD